ncbi:transposase of ISPca3, IS481 family [Syntrophotalea carbinolica DSM 2380]|uniref:Transposase of ISPca3, IS481 family n=2 Tax=Syntrophotalea carbinolica (strain DSM 2380 / NBRC 103641 / GraBd1) TaxID=338963 RepID=Q3A2H4_SYNC1|nr:IS481-like element ISPca3 family transposase [Syntrophotalea carbinolica]ABA89433.1 transposase of ISPca3, IS481 family [Syntrophotalea carbinolica DSM 2380]
MTIRLHANATTTPKIRRYIQESEKSHKALAKELGISIDTVRRWRKRDDVHDRSHTAHRLNTTMTEAQEAVVIELRRSLLLSLDDLLVVTREFVNADVSRAGLDRCLRRHGVSRLADLIPKEETANNKPKTFKNYDPGFVHVDIKYLPQMPDETSRRYLFVGIDRATRWVYLEVCKSKSAQAAKGFLNRLVAKAPFVIKKLLTDNDKAFTDRFSTAGERKPTGNHVFDKTCVQHGIEHRLIPPRHPQTNGMVERFNGRISEVLATTRFDSAENLEQTLLRYGYLYNQHIPQRALGHKTPIQALKDWQKKKPKLFRKQVRNHAGPDSYRIL